MQRKNNFLDQPLTVIKGIGPQKSQILQSEAGILTIEDLLYYRPRKYIDRTRLLKIYQCSDGEVATISGIIKSRKLSFSGKKRIIFDLQDDSGTAQITFFGNVTYFNKKIEDNSNLIITGKVTVFKNRIQFNHPEYDIVGDNSDSSSLENINTGRIVPLYRSSDKLSKSGFDSRGFRRLLKTVFNTYSSSIKELPDEIKPENYYSTHKSLYKIHFPESFEELEQARIRLAYNELFYFHCYLQLKRTESNFMEIEDSYSKENSKIQDMFIKRLGFKLTTDQVYSINEINSKLMHKAPMNKLLQGDVGSGKTVVALATALFSIEKGGQVALMAPTSVLAKQHFDTASKLIGDIVKLGILTGDLKNSEKDLTNSRLESGDIDLIIGTHSLFQERVLFKNLTYIIIDEQHKFGVRQRSKLRSKGSLTNLLVMSATPIPRSLCLTQYGDLDSINIKTRPAGRETIKTLSFSIERISGIYNSMKKYIGDGRQIYYILPLIEDSDSIDIKSAESKFNELSILFSDYRLSLLHGRMNQDEKNRVMDDFSNGKIDILISTSVIEVGIDVPNANVIVIEHAERFGLAQLHQLRGRVGRGIHKSFCILLHPEKISSTARERINILTETDDGFQISEKDLKLRGSGQLIGTRQHGFNDFEFIDICKDLNVIEAAREDAKQYLKKIKNEKITGDFKDPLTELKFTNKLRSKRVLSILS